MKRLKIDVNVSKNDRRLRTNSGYSIQVISDVNSLGSPFDNLARGKRGCLESADLIQDRLDHSQRLVIVFSPFSKFIWTNLLEKVMNLQQNVTNVEFLNLILSHTEIRNDSDFIGSI